MQRFLNYCLIDLHGKRIIITRICYGLQRIVLNETMQTTAHNSNKITSYSPLSFSSFLKLNQRTYCFVEHASSHVFILGIWTVYKPVAKSTVFNASVSLCPVWRRARKTLSAITGRWTFWNRKRNFKMELSLLLLSCIM